MQITLLPEPKRLKLSVLSAHSAVTHKAAQVHEPDRRSPRHRGSRLPGHVGLATVRGASPKFVNAATTGPQDSEIVS